MWFVHWQKYDSDQWTTHAIMIVQHWTLQQTNAFQHSATNGAKTQKEKKVIKSGGKQRSAFLLHISASSKIIKVEKNNNNINNNRHNVLINDMEIESENEADTVQIIIKKSNTMKKEHNQDQEKAKF